MIPAASMGGFVMSSVPAPVQMNQTQPDVRLYCPPPGPVMLVAGGAPPPNRATNSSFVSYQQAPVSLPLQTPPSIPTQVQPLAYAPAAVMPPGPATQPSNGGATPGLLPRPQTVSMNVGYRYPFQPPYM